MQVMHGDVAGDGQSIALGRAHHVHGEGAGEPAHVHARTRFAHQLEDRRQRDRFRGRRNAGQPQTRGHLAVVRHAETCEVRILRPQPDAMAEGRGVLQRPLQDLRVDDGPLRVRERHASGFGELAHLRDGLARESDGQCTDGIDACLVERARTVLEHLDQSGLVERRIGVRRTREARHAPRHCGGHLRFERSLVLEPGLAQTHGEIDQPRRDDHAAHVERAIGAPPAGAAIDTRHHAIGDEQRRLPVDALRWIDHASAADLDLHEFPARMLMTAMRTAMPNVTCDRMTA